MARIKETFFLHFDPYLFEIPHAIWKNQPTSDKMSNKHPGMFGAI
jgi:hypothetical protein